MRILITGASGAVGAALARSLAPTHELRGLSREPSRVGGGLPIELVQGDALTGAGLDRALDGIEVCYYLIHSMEPSTDASFERRDRTAARRFAAAAAAAGVDGSSISAACFRPPGHARHTSRAASRSSKSCSRRHPTASRCGHRS